jgi:hypothetical protein
MLVLTLNPLLQHRNPDSFLHLGSIDKMCHQNSCVHLSVEEATAAEESLLTYCKPVELYNILRCRALHNVLSGISFHNPSLLFLAHLCSLRMSKLEPLYYIITQVFLFSCVP